MMIGGDDKQMRARDPMIATDIEKWTEISCNWAVPDSYEGCLHYYFLGRLTKIKLRRDFQRLTAYTNLLITRFRRRMIDRFDTSEH